MATSNFKSEYGLLVTGDSTLLGNVVVQNTSSFAANTILPSSNGSLLGNSSLRWEISGVGGNLSGGLVVAGNLAVNASALVVTSNTTTTRVGIATATPDATLAVTGSANVSGDVRFGQTLNVAANTTVGTNAFFVDTTSKLVRVGTVDVSNTNAMFAVNGNTFLGANAYVSDQLSAGSIRCFGNFIVDGNLSYNGTATADIIPQGNTYALGSVSNTSNRWILYAVSGSVDLDFLVGGKLTLSNTTTTHTIASNVNIDSGTLFVDASTNRVGINNTAPAQSLVVVGTANITANSWLSNTVTLTSNSTLSLANIAGATVISGNLAVNTSALVVVSNTSTTRVGVATASPDATLAVGGTANVSGNVNFGNTLFVSGNTRVGNTTSFVLAKTDGALRVTKEIEIGNTGIYSNSSVITTAFTNTVIDTFITTEYDAAKYVISYHSTSNTQIFGVTELLLVHNGTTVIITEYGSVFSANVAFSVDADIPTLSTNCNIHASANQGNLAVTMTRISMI